MTFWKVFQRICACQEKKLDSTQIWSVFFNVWLPVPLAASCIQYKKLFCALLAKVTYFAFTMYIQASFQKSALSMPNKLKKAKANDDVEELAKKEVNRLFRILWSFQNIKRVLTMSYITMKL